jgi:hypothetical protein
VPDILLLGWIFLAMPHLLHVWYTARWFLLWNGLTSIMTTFVVMIRCPSQLRIHPTEERHPITVW